MSFNGVLSSNLMVSHRNFGEKLAIKVGDLDKRLYVCICSRLLYYGKQCGSFKLNGLHLPPPTEWRENVE